MSAKSPSHSSTNDLRQVAVKSAFRTVDLPSPRLTLDRGLVEQGRSDKANLLNPTRLKRSPPSPKRLAPWGGPIIRCAFRNRAYRSLPYAPRLHWLGSALILIALSMVGLAIAGLSGSLHLSVVVLVAMGIFISCGTGGTFALVPLLFPDRPGAAAGFIGGVSTAAGIVYPLVFASGSNISMGYLYVALYLFLPFILFYFWATRYEGHPKEHGLLTQVFAAEEA